MDWTYIVILEIFFCLGKTPNERCFFDTQAFEFDEIEQAVAMSEWAAEENKTWKEVMGGPRYDILVIQVPTGDSK